MSDRTVGLLKQDLLLLLFGALLFTVGLCMRLTDVLFLVFPYLGLGLMLFAVLDVLRVCGRLGWE